MPEAGAAGTSAAFLGSCRGGKGTYGPRGRVAPLGFRGAWEVGAVEDEGLLAMAEVERKFAGRLLSAVSSVTGSFVLVLGGSLPFGKDFDAGGGCAGAGDGYAPLVETDWERCRIEDSETFRLLWLWLLEER